MACIKSKEFNGEVRLDADNFLTVRFELKIIDEEITALCLCMDRMDAMDTLKSVNTPVQTIAINLRDSLVICVTRKLPTFVNLEPNLKVDPHSENLIFKDE